MTDQEAESLCQYIAELYPRWMTEGRRSLVAAIFGNYPVDDVKRLIFTYARDHPDATRPELEWVKSRLRATGQWTGERRWSIGEESAFADWQETRWSMRLPCQIQDYCAEKGFPIPGEPERRAAGDAIRENWRRTGHDEARMRQARNERASRQRDRLDALAERVSAAAMTEGT